MNKKTRRDFLASFAAAGSAALMPALIQENKPHRTLPSLKGKKILFTYGGWPGHEPEKFKDYMAPWMKEEGAEVLIHSSLDPYADNDLMGTIDLVVQTVTMSQITPKQEKGLLDAIEKNGTGIAGWHGGLCDSFRNNTAYQFMTGGQWVAHPGGIVEHTVNIINRKDEITKGLNDFNLTSEQYYMHVDPNVKVLATTRFTGAHHSWIDGCTMPVTWKKMHGKGRIFYTSIGHNLDHITKVPDAIEMLKRGIRWAAASKYEPSEKWVAPVYHSKK
jgi:uncharacterized protein